MASQEPVLEYLRRQANPVDPATIASALSLREPMVRRALGNLVRQGEARRAGGGKFTIASQKRRQSRQGR